jgi:hypothetical protein
VRYFFVRDRLRELGRTLHTADERRDAMLELRPGCECCNKDLSPDSPDARICSFECTFCADCADNVLNGRCPNCGGELVARPRRPASKLANHPPSTERVFNPDCAAQPR